MDVCYWLTVLALWAKRRYRPYWRFMDKNIYDVCCWVFPLFIDNGNVMVNNVYRRGETPRPHSKIQRLKGRRAVFPNANGHTGHVPMQGPWPPGGPAWRFSLCDDYCNLINHRCLNTVRNFQTEKLLSGAPKERAQGFITNKIVLWGMAGGPCHHFETARNKI